MSNTKNLTREIIIKEAFWDGWLAGIEARELVRNGEKNKDKLASHASKSLTKTMEKLKNFEAEIQNDEKA